MGGQSPKPLNEDLGTLANKVTWHALAASLSTTTPAFTTTPAHTLDVLHTAFQPLPGQVGGRDGPGHGPGDSSLCERRKTILLEKPVVAWDTAGTCGLFPLYLCFRACCL